MPTTFTSLSQSAQHLLAEHPEIVVTLASRIHLRYEEEGDAEGNVCMINSEEVRQEFKDSFTFADVVNYLYGSFHLPLHYAKSEKEFLTNFPYPDNAETFWQLVKAGNSSLKNH